MDDCRNASTCGNHSSFHLNDSFQYVHFGHLAEHIGLFLSNQHAICLWFSRIFFGWFALFLLVGFIKLSGIFMSSIECIIYSATHRASSNNGKKNVEFIEWNTCSETLMSFILRSFGACFFVITYPCMALVINGFDVETIFDGLLLITVFFIESNLIDEPWIRFFLNIWFYKIKGHDNLWLTSRHGIVHLSVY
jgi:hypothetical protein